MKIRKAACVPLTLGLLASLLALWASAAPVLGNGASVLGGWHWFQSDIDGKFYGCSHVNPEACTYHCSGTYWTSCTAGPCLGGGYLAVVSAKGDGVLSSIGASPCYGCPGGQPMTDAACYY
jgi:hypothetical protein